jgi:hypothetical protein
MTNDTLYVTRNITLEQLEAAIGENKSQTAQAFLFRAKRWIARNISHPTELCCRIECRLTTEDTYDGPCYRLEVYVSESPWQNSYQGFWNLKVPTSAASRKSSFVKKTSVRVNTYCGGRPYAQRLWGFGAYDAADRIETQIKALKPVVIPSVTVESPEALVVADVATTADPAEAKDLAEATTKYTDPYRQARHYACRRAINGKHTLPIIHQGERYERLVRVPAKFNAEAYVRILGEEFALVLKDGQLHTDR